MGDPTSNRATLRNKFELEKFRSKIVKSLPEIEPSPSNYDQRQKATEIEEILKHMKHLPNYLEKGKPVPDRALSFGVMDWARLEKWQYRHHHNNCSPSNSNSSSTVGSSPRSSRYEHSRSPSRQNVHRLTLQSHFKVSHQDDFNGNVDNFRYFEDLRRQSRSLLVTGSCYTSPSSCSKGKLKIRDESVYEQQNVLEPSRIWNEDHSEKHENVVFVARNGENSQTEPSRNKTPERKRSTESSNSDLKTRSISPLRRFSFSVSSNSRSESPIFQKSTTETNRTHSSPLRRLFDPIFPSKPNKFDDEDSSTRAKTRAKTKPDFKISKEIRVDNATSSRKQALFQTIIKYDRLLFTFAVENNKDVLASTVTSLNSSQKDNHKDKLLYTFFTVNEVKKKNVNWLSPGTTKSKNYDYVPNVAAQMKVSNSCNNTREFVLFSVNSNVQPQEELEAIVIKFSEEERFETTVVLPGGSHGVPSKGGLSPLIDRWRSGGVCDCGGWDEGCRLEILANQVQSSGSRSDKSHVNNRHFKLFFQGEVQNKRPIFSLSALKEGIFSIDYNSSLSPLQAFSICISVVESQKTRQHTDFRKHIHQEVPVIYTRIPRIQRNTTGKVGYM